ncbi:MAG: glycosyltransferase involved in cell wall biosynthesis [Colwellia sp.]|jgi:glycosyltransferase involved in cell wall biosynthesis
MHEKFSVLLSLYSKESPVYFDLSLDSISKQKLLPDEVVIILDGPITADLNKVIYSWVDILNIKIYSLDINVGLSAALNYGLSKCKFELVARMDTDDICLPDRFLKQVDLMSNNPSIDICGSWANDIDEYGTFLRLRTVPCDNRTIIRLIWSCPIIHPSVIFRKSKIERIGSYNVDAPLRQDDYELWLRAASNGLVFSNIPEALINYRYPISYYGKNTIRVGLNRFKLGVPYVWKYDRRFFSVIAIFYPIVRPLIPIFIINIISKFDPRRK